MNSGIQTRRSGGILQTGPNAGKEELSESKGTKHDDGKPRMDLIDSYCLEELAKVLTMGASKYDAHNWRKGIEYSRIYAAIQRHLNEYWKGTDVDPESGLPHLAHAMCGLQFLLWHSKFKPELDDRWSTIKGVSDR